VIFKVAKDVARTYEVEVNRLGGLSPS